MINIGVAPSYLFTYYELAYIENKLYGENFLLSG
jgi:hypothetical protein